MIAAVSLKPSAVAMTLADPRLTPRTSPLVSTVATAALSLVHVTLRRETIRSFASRSVASNFANPVITSVAGSGASVTDATGRAGPTVTVAVPRVVPLVTVIVTLPGLTAVIVS